jgi:poly(hydroxyalkanoate) granule-associated protein
VGIVNVGHQIWLAGLGALARAQSEGPKLFESLVEEGSAVHEHRREATQRAVKEAWEGVRGAIDTRTESVRGKASETWDNLEKIFQSRVQKALQQLGVPTTQEIHSLSRKVNELTRSVQELTRHQPRAKSTARRKPGTSPPAPLSGEGAAI